MSSPEWHGACDALATELLEACRPLLRPDEVDLHDKTSTMWAQEDEPQIPPHRPIGLIYRYQLRVACTRHFLWISWLPYRGWKTVLSFGMEEMFGSGAWTRGHGVWCEVEDARLNEAARLVTGRFASRYGLKLSFVPRAA
jgi:hypothetical protein